MNMRETKFGTMMLVFRDGEPVMKLKCPGCGGWGDLDDDQFHGRVSVDHTGEGCTYHETHDFAEAFAVEAGNEQ